ncbi:hypothetical protein M3193_07970 [Sporosarcina luteola]|uniref:hypothetical protein n=1 Tax=Sporosarcina luteola TaxID=582850 RepID=UPI00203E21A8|nr:hypothetical protein [Sporosarcina luteola]MCM3744078.1 hypothetical protein [Sporosarcina luteola]
MNINFTEKQFKALLDLAFLGEWMANSTRSHDDRFADYDELFQYICSHAKDMGCADIVPYDHEVNGYYPTQEYEEQLHAIIDDNDDHVFWEKLSANLAKRDLDREGGTFESLDDRFRRLLEIEEKYETEFEDNGLANVVIKEDK